MEITVVVHQEGAGFWSEIDELPGCFASGRTLSELREAVSEAIGLYLDEEPVGLGDRVLRPGRTTIEVEPAT
jgi:predicted RNase H-like HicB family nuclease